MSYVDFVLCVSVCVCIDGHNAPVFQEKFVFSLIEGLREISVAVWNSNIKDDRTWCLYTNSGG